MYQLIPEPEPESRLNRKVEIAGIPLEGVAGLVGELIMKQAQLDLVLEQLYAIHDKKNSAYCGCGLLLDRCETGRILKAYWKQNKPPQQA